MFVSYHPPYPNFCAYPYLFIAQNVIFLEKKGKNLKLPHIPTMHGIQKTLKKERRKHQISAYNTSSVDLNRSRYPTT